MNSKGFVDNQTNVDTPNDIHKSDTQNHQKKHRANLKKVPQQSSIWRPIRLKNCNEGEKR